jgi:hypothetical protein
LQPGSTFSPAKADGGAEGRTQRRKKAGDKSEAGTAADDAEEEDEK